MSSIPFVVTSLLCCSEPTRGYFDTKWKSPSKRKIFLDLCARVPYCVFPETSALCCVFLVQGHSTTISIFLCFLGIYEISFHHFLISCHLPLPSIRLQTFRCPRRLSFPFDYISLTCPLDNVTLCSSHPSIGFDPLHSREYDSNWSLSGLYAYNMKSKFKVDYFYVLGWQHNRYCLA